MPKIQKKFNQFILKEVKTVDFYTPLITQLSVRNFSLPIAIKKKKQYALKDL